MAAVRLERREQHLRRAGLERARAHGRVRALAAQHGLQQRRAAHAELGVEVAAAHDEAGVAREVDAKLHAREARGRVGRVAQRAQARADELRVRREAQHGVHEARVRAVVDEP